MTDMGVNHVQLGNGETVIDLRGVTVNEDVLLEGYTAMDSKGNLVTGSASLQGGGSGEAVEEIFYVPFAFGATGFVLDGVTHADILAAYNAGKRIIGKGYVPRAANLGWSGMFELPLSNFADNSSFVLTLTSGQNTCESWVNSDNTIISYIRTLVSFNDNVTGELNASSTDTQIPSAKAVYDALGGLKIAVSNTVPTVDDRSVLTIVTGG